MLPNLELHNRYDVVIEETIFITSTDNNLNTPEKVINWLIETNLSFSSEFRKQNRLHDKLIKEEFEIIYD